MMIATFIFAICAFGFSLFTFIEVMAQKKSTHKFIPIDLRTGQISDDLTQETKMPIDEDIIEAEMKRIQKQKFSNIM